MLIFSYLCRIISLACDMSKRPNWIFFDLDDTLWNFSACSLAALKILYSESRILQMAYASFDLFSDSYHVLNSELWKLYHANAISRDYLQHERFARLLSGVESHVKSCDEAMLLNARYLHILSGFPTLIDGAAEVLEALSKRYLLAVLSNGFIDTQYRKMHSSGLDRLITRTIVSDEIGIQKPDRRIFDYAVRETGAHNPILVGDNPDADIRGAIDAGWKAIFFDVKVVQPAFPRQALRITDLRELLKIF